MRRWWVGTALVAGVLLVSASALALHQSYMGFPIVRIMLNGNPVKSDVPPVLIGSRTMLPLRAFAEAMGATVEWDQETGTAFVVTNPGAAPAIASQAAAALTALKQSDWAALATLVDPVKGLRFSPYGHIRTGPGGDLVFTALQVSGFGTDTMVYKWGSFDGTGAGIYLTPADYRDRFIYSLDFAAAPVVSYNRLVGHNTLQVNMHQVYPNAQFVEYHFPHVDPASGGIDWQSLRLVFEEHAGNWSLVGVIHDQWTI